jgi:hypothetical protein
MIQVALEEIAPDKSLEMMGIKILGAEEGTRTPTPLRVHGPEPCASANSATSARVEASEKLAAGSKVIVQAECRDSQLPAIRSSLLAFRFSSNSATGSSTPAIGVLRLHSPAQARTHFAQDDTTEKSFRPWEKQLSAVNRDKRGRKAKGNSA